MLDIFNYSRHSLLTFFKELNIIILKPWRCVEREWLFVILGRGGRRTRPCNYSSSGDSALFCCCPVERLPFTSVILVVPWYTYTAGDLQLVEVSMWMDQHLDGCSNASQLAMWRWGPTRTSLHRMFQWSRDPFADCSSCPLSRLEDKLWSMFCTMPFVMK